MYLLIHTLYIISLFFLPFFLQRLQIDNLLHLAQMLIDPIHLPIHHFLQILQLHFPTNRLLFLQLFLTLQMKGSINGKPIQFSTLILIIYKSFYACKIA